MRHTLVKVIGSVAAVVVVTLGTLVLAPGAASAGPGDPPGITDYANYPEAVTPAIFPAGCQGTGSGVVVGDVFTATTPGGTTIGPVTNMRDLGSMAPGTRVDMSWTRFGTGCNGAGVSLSVKRADRPTFDANANQELITSAYEYCGPQAEPCTPGADGRYHLSIVMPSARLACNYQADAVVGPPLAIVGPNGSYYTSSTRVANGKPGGRTTLISANNGAASECRPPQPVADAVLDCSVGGVVLSLWNRGDIEATFEITVTGGAAPEVETFDIDGGGEAANEVTREILMPEGASRTIRVTADGVEIMNQTFTRECEDLAATITSECVEATNTGLVTISVTNDGQVDAPITVTRDGTEIDSFTVAGGADDGREYAHEPGVPATFAVSGPGGELASTDVVVTCVEPSVIVRPRSAPPASSGVALPITGPRNVAPLIAMAGALLIAGGMLVRLSARRAAHLQG